MLHEISRRIIHLPKYEDIDIVWHNNVLTVRCDSGLHLFDFSYNIKCLDKSIDFFESKIHTSTSSPATEFFPKNAIKFGMRNMELSQMILDPSLWPHNNHLMEAAIIIGFEWSPIDFIHNHESVLATVNSAGNVDLYAQARHKWNKLENLSLKLKREIELKISNLIPSMSYGGKVNFKLAREAAYVVETSSICWCPVLNADKTCYFVTAQKNGGIMFWLLKSDNESVDAELLHITNENKEEIVTMKWIPITSNKFILIISNVHGQILGYQCQIIDNMLEILSMHPLWVHKDKMIAQYIEYEFLNDNIAIVCNKHRHLLTLLIDKSCGVVLQCVKNINDQRITSLVKTKERFYTSTVNRELYEVQFVMENESMDVNFVAVDVKGVSTAYELCSFVFSTNNVFLAFALLNRTVLYRKLPLTLEIVLYSEESSNLEVNKIINNPSKTLTDVWDCIESLRCKTLKSKKLPLLDYDKLYADSRADLFYGKVYLLLLNLYNNLEITVQNGSKGLLPESSVDIIKSNILARHSVELINKFCKMHSENITENAADKLEYQCLHMALIYLKEFCNKNKMEINELLSSNILKILQKIKPFQCICQWCDNILDGFICKDGHMNSFCSVSFVPIEANDYLICRNCGATARTELYADKPKCVFCDLYLCNCYLPF